VAASLLTSSDSIEVLGDQSSGEAECVVYSVDGALFVGVGSVHTDRKAEAIGVSLSKQMCAKPVSREVWRLDDVAGHWDTLVLRSYAGVGGERWLYQEGSVKAMLPPTELFRLCGGGGLAAGTAMFCGTLAVHGHDRTIGSLRDGIGRSGARPQDHAQLSHKDAARQG
jgi:hypothetical protein